MRGFEVMLREFLSSMRETFLRIKLWVLSHYRFTGGEVTRKGLIYRHLPAWKYVSVVDGPASDS